MKTEQFNAIMESLEDHIGLCKKYFRGVHTTADLESLTITEARNLRDFAKVEVERQTKAAMVDFYHIIGMGGLTVTQTQKFIGKMKEYLEFRPALKVLSVGFLDLDDLPHLPVKTRYKTQVLGNVVLKSNVKDTDDEGIELDADEGSEEILCTTESCPFILEGKTIYIKSAEDFLELVPKLKLCGGNLENFQKKLTNGGEYLGITWQARTPMTPATDPYKGKITSATVYPKLKEYYALCKV